MDTSDRWESRRQLPMDKIILSDVKKIRKMAMLVKVRISQVCMMGSRPPPRHRHFDENFI
jgi:hypothetical protein